MNAQEEITLSLILARTRNGVIGHKGKMPWRIPSELAYFKQATLGKPVLMGRKTWDSLHVQPLPGRDNLVLSRDPSFTAAGAQCFTDFDTMVARGKGLARAAGTRETVVIGGGMLYELALPCADRVYLTQIEADLDGDVHFADLDRDVWRLTSVEAGQSGPRDEHSYFVKVFDRK